MQIHILGGAGSGKSYIANELSIRWSIPHFDMDDIYWDNSVEMFGVKNPEDIRDQKLSSIVDQFAWINEGVYISWMDPSFASADYIFVLTVPLEMQEERIWTRYEQRKSGLLPSKKKETIESVQELIEWNRNYNQVSLQHFLNHSIYQNKIVTLDDNAKIYKYLHVDLNRNNWRIQS
ncbi:hypothetical protein NV379_17650 [Paenibacillus sp. N1-5-1-14]|uniref:hypothetical protein n=1 Tax=Paenibacillus radicibacter TaxID=2972488 RepID=UPI002158DBEB|nr:hypothetical protein [Paenibacillus radicibacter]MCR8644483.1 hypothetical protein [Paenibacillus radicibacter]